MGMSINSGYNSSGINIVVDKQKQGRKNNRDGAKFELDFRKMMEKEGWIISKFQNNIDLQTGEIIQARGYFIPGRGLTLGKGFPDFVMFRMLIKENKATKALYELQFVECKRNIKRLSKEEKMKLEVLKQLGHKCFIAYLDEKEIKLKEFLGYEDKA